MRIPAGSLAIALVILGATSVAACSGPDPSRQFRTVLQFPTETAPLPVVLNDETGLVTSVDSAPLDPQFDTSEPAARADPTDPSAFIVSWLGGACDNDAVLWFTQGQGTYSLSVEVHGKFALLGGCPALGVPRDVRIVTSRPIPIDLIVAAGGH
ncbi:MAG: hypothetical protein HY264_05575 [Chloroflexi bacterium]|nr:hypothetical protein [Chloroflexota bacterium]